MKILFKKSKAAHCFKHKYKMNDNVEVHIENDYQLFSFQDELLSSDLFKIAKNKVTGASKPVRLHVLLRTQKSLLRIEDLPLLAESVGF